MGTKKYRWGMNDFIVSMSLVLCLPGQLFADTNFDQLKEKALQGDVQSQFAMGLYFDGRNEFSEAAQWYLKAAEKNHPAAQNAIGSLLQAGQGIKQDYIQAFNWYQKAVQQDFSDAYPNLGFMYDLGLGVPEDDAKAFEIYTQGANKGNLISMYNLGLMCLNGQGVDQDKIEAYKWLDLVRFFTQSSKDMTLKWRVRGVLDSLKNDLTKAQIKEGKKRAKQWSQEHPVYEAVSHKYAH